MKRKMKHVVLTVLLAFVGVALILLPGLSVTDSVHAAACNVPSGTHPTIQSGVDDISCDNINLTAKLYVENVTITRTVTVQGQGAESSAVDGNASGSVFAIQPGLAVTITDMTITNGKALKGGGIHNDGSTLALDSVRMTSNSATNIPDNEGGGGIYNDKGEVHIDNSVISGNSAKRFGGGIFSDDGEIRISNSIISGNSAYVGGGMHNGNKLTVVSSTFDTNSAESSGGGIYSQNLESSRFASVTISNSVFSDNSAELSGGGIRSYDAVTITFSTVSGNSAGSGGGVLNYGELTVSNSTFRGNSGGGIDSSGELNIVNSTFSGNSGGGIDSYGELNIVNSTFSGNSSAHNRGVIYALRSATISNTIIANSQGGSDCNGSITSLGYNLASDDSCSLTATGDIPNTNPHLGPLEGSPGYHPLLVGSPAINGGNPDGCTDHLGNILITDQLGQPRVGRCDIGAYEYQGVVLEAYLPIGFRDFCIDFFDKFNDPASGWDKVDNEFVLTEYLNGEFRILTRDSKFFYTFPSPSCNRENYVVEVDARWMGTPGSSYGLIFGITANFDNFYLYLINTDFREFLLLRFYPGGLTAIVPATYSPAILGSNSTNHFKVTRNGAQITLGINGAVLGTWSDGKITGLTGAGIFSDPYSDSPKSDARFDNFSFKLLPGSTSAQNAEISSGATSPSPIPRESQFAAPIGVPWWYMED